MQELAIDCKAIGTPGGIEENVTYSDSLGLPELMMAPCVNGGLFVICGSSPSIKDYVEDIRQKQLDGFPICAVKGAYDFLRCNDITPDIFLSVEPRYREIKDPAMRTSFLLASRCNPQLFDDLKEYCVCRWHSYTNVEEPYYDKRMGIGGGSTSGLRAVNMAFVLGFKRIQMYGMDSCLVNNEKRVGQGEIHKDVITTDVIVDGRSFIATMAMAAQAMDFQMIWKIMPDMHIEIAGDGLLAAIIRFRKKEGLIT